MFCYGIVATKRTRQENPTRWIKVLSFLFPKKLKLRLEAWAFRAKL